ncbi:hypothetical protein CB452P1_00005 [Clostridium phage CB452P1]|nr:hypothetical protein CB452P1_00005 [Clostridium phage CB452P1]
MEFISANEFLKQDEKVQKVFLDWWRPSKGDLVSHIDNANDNNLNISIIVDYFSYGENWKKYPVKGYNIETNVTMDISKNFIPLLTEGQLRKFIDDKTAFKLEITQFEDGEWSLCLYKNGSRDIEIDDMDLLQAYWKAAIRIAKES